MLEGVSEKEIENILHKILSGKQMPLANNLGFTRTLNEGNFSFLCTPVCTISNRIAINRTKNLSQVTKIDITDDSYVELTGITGAHYVQVRCHSSLDGSTPQHQYCKSTTWAQLRASK